MPEEIVNDGSDASPKTDTAAKPNLSPAFLDSIRAMKLKHAIPKGVFKDGTAVTEEDKAWYEAYSAAHPPKTKAPKVDGGKRTRIQLDDIDEDTSALPDPAPNAPAPKVATETKAKGKKAASGWQAKWKMEITLPNGQKLTPGEERELVCVQGAALVCGIAKAAEEGLALIGAKPYLGMTTDTIFGAWVLTLDKVLPDLDLQPEHIALGGLAAILAPAALNFKKIRAAREAQGAKSDRDKKLEALKRSTAEAEAREREQRAREEQEAQAKQAAPPQAQPVAQPAPEPEPSVEVEPTPPAVPPVQRRYGAGSTEVRPNIHQKWDEVDPMFKEE